MKVSYPAPNCVSVWIGNFPSESEFDQCVDMYIEKRLKLNIPISSICEVGFTPDQKSVRKLIEEFSGWESFIDQAEAAAKSMAVGSSNSALVCYYTKIEDAPELWGTMRFLGSFFGSDVMP